MSNAQESPADLEDNPGLEIQRPTEKSTHVETPIIKLPEEGLDTANDERPLPLPPRPSILASQRKVSNVAAAAFPTEPSSTRPRLQATATTAVSRTDIHTQAYQDGWRETYAASRQTSPPPSSWSGWGSIRRLKIQDGDDSASIRSVAPTVGTGAGVESLLGGFAGHEQTTTWDTVHGQLEETGLRELHDSTDEEILHNFDEEFDEVVASDADGIDEGQPKVYAGVG